MVFIGWDVGGWNCDRNPRSRDAIVILDFELRIVGSPWRGNLRELINQAQTSEAFIAGLFRLCDREWHKDDQPVFLAIDTPLAFSEAFVALVTSGQAVKEDIGESQSNPYLYRLTERLCFERGLRPLSPVKDLIGSQATKGMHVLAKFAPQIERPGVWSNGSRLRAIEAYPSACRGSATIAEMRAAYRPLGNQDKEDALLCALLASLYAHKRALLWNPPADAPPAEGWIWVPNDVLQVE